ncbi:MAG: DUF4139 domain-containing protein [Verrucomicrobia bacterium]|nr:DUF4139 domain-containing protein [Verrucomicrobiota bacterium]
MKKWMTLILLAACGVALPARAGIDLVTLPERDSVQLTIYNSADLTLVREVRKLTLQKGLNKLSFGWANTLIDPTSLRLRAVDRPDAVELLDVSYPPRLNSQAVWTVRSKIEGEVLVEITFFTSGISWRAFYMATLSQDEKDMLLEGYVRVTNNSGEDYADAQTRMIVGVVNLLDEIAELARRKEPYGRPYPPMVNAPMAMRKAGREMPAAFAGAMDFAEEAAPKEIVKEGLSEYFLYTIPGTETILNQWSKRLPSFKPVRVPVVNLFRYDEERYGPTTMRLLYFHNDEKHNLGETPLPDGFFKVYRAVDKEEHLSYEGATPIKYIPVEQEAELNLGPARGVKVEPKLLKIQTDHYMFNGTNGNISGYDQAENWTLEVNNYRDIPVRVEILRMLRHQYADEIKPSGELASFEKLDLQRLKFVVELPPNTKKEITYQIVYHEGERRERR